MLKRHKFLQMSAWWLKAKHYNPPKKSTPTSRASTHLPWSGTHRRQFRCFGWIFGGCLALKLQFGFAPGQNFWFLLLRSWMMWHVSSFFRICTKEYWSAAIEFKDLCFEPLPFAFCCHDTSTGFFRFTFIFHPCKINFASETIPATAVVSMASPCWMFGNFW